MGSFHGITSLVIFALAILFGLIAVARDSLAAAALYSMLLAAATLTVCGVYCTKCPGRKTACAHRLPGLIARHLPARRQTPYSATDLGLTALSLTCMVGYPQPWLWDRPLLLAGFWLLTAAAVIEIVTRVCRCCRNARCPVQRLGAGGQVMERR